MPSISIITVDKLGKLKDQNIKEFSEKDLYKKANFKSAEGFRRHTVWKNLVYDKKRYNIALYGKTDGNAGKENKYEFPSPVDSTLFFGSCILVNFEDDTFAVAKDLKTSEWKPICEQLMGGMDDLSLMSDDENEEDDEYGLLPVGIDGYARDGFIAPDDEEFEEEEEEEEPPLSEEEEEIDEDLKTKKKTKNKKVCGIYLVKKRNNKKAVPSLDIASSQITSDTYLDCQSELTEEQYLA